MDATFCHHNFETHVIIDHSNIKHFQDMNFNISWESMTKYLQAAHNATSASYFYSLSQRGDQDGRNRIQGYTSFLRNALGFEIKEYDQASHHHNIKQEKRVDAGIVQRIVECSYNFSCSGLILFSGDGDFAESLELAKRRLDKVLVYTGKNAISQELIQAVGKNNVKYLENIECFVKRETIKEQYYNKIEKKLSQIK